MEVRGMSGTEPVRVVVSSNDQVDVVALSTGNYVASVALGSDIQLQGDLLWVGHLSIVIDHSDVVEAQELVEIAARIPSGPRPAVKSNRSDGCAHCGSPINPRARFCVRCRTPVPRRVRNSPIEDQWGAESFDDWDDDSDGNFGDLIGPGLGRSRSRQRVSEKAQRYVVFLVAALFLGVIVVLVTRSGSSESPTPTSVGVSIDEACEMLTTYAYVGIPATYVDEGAQLLSTLSEQFSALGLGDVSDLLNDAVDRVYEGSDGQVEAKNLLVDTANLYC